MTTANAIRCAIKDLLDVGYVEVNQKGGKHRKFHHPRANHTVLLPYRPNGDRLYGSKGKDIKVALELGRRHV